RQHRGLIGSFDAAESAILGWHRDDMLGDGFRLDRDKVVARARAEMQEFDVRPPDPFLKCSKFSGGNQQKIIIAREIKRNPDLLLVGQPTRGVDIGAIEFIHRKLVGLRDAGAAVLLVSAELEEVLSLSDRVLVMYQGRIVGEVNSQQVAQEEIGLMMTGGRRN
nr:heme ABC transporter ATP-binding protein [Acidobacteriota bacterium]